MNELNISTDEIKIQEIKKYTDGYSAIVSLELPIDKSLHDRLGQIDINKNHILDIQYKSTEDDFCTIYITDIFAL